MFMGQTQEIDVPGCSIHGLVVRERRERQILVPHWEKRRLGKEGESLNNYFN